MCYKQQGPVGRTAQPVSQRHEWFLNGFNRHLPGFELAVPRLSLLLSCSRFGDDDVDYCHGAQGV